MRSTVLVGGGRSPLSARRYLACPVNRIILLSFLFAAAALGATDAPPVEPMDDSFSPLLFIGVLIVLFLIAVSIMVGVIAAVGTAIVVGLGIISSSAFIGLFRRRFSSGLRALHYQLCAVAALPAGIAVLWLASHLFNLHLQHRDIFIVGATAGVIAGLLLAFAFDRLVGIAYRRFAPPAIPNATGNA